jgi:hypothetical protein
VQLFTLAARYMHRLAAAMHQTKSEDLENCQGALGPSHKTMAWSKKNES